MLGWKGRLEGRCAMVAVGVRVVMGSGWGVVMVLDMVVVVELDAGRERRLVRRSWGGSISGSRDAR